MRPLLTLLLTASIGAPGALALPGYFSVGKGSKVTFDAASSLHGFHGGTEAVTGIVSYDPAAPLEASGEIVIDPLHLKSGNRKRDGGMRGRALEVEKYPTITMKMIRFVPSKGQAPGATVEGNIHGELDLHGVSRKLVVPAEVTSLPGGNLRVTGKVGLDMRNWDIRPPRNKILFVTVRVLPNVTVGFDLTLVSRAPTKLEQQRERLAELKARLQASD